MPTPAQKDALASQKRYEAAARAEGKMPPKHKFFTKPDGKRSYSHNHTDRTTHAKKGESLWSIAERTVPKGKSVDSWFQAIKKMNAGRRIFTGTGVSLPKGSSNALAADRAGAWSTATKSPKKSGRGR